jgi:conjugal transfer ATP-binding protein TraC
MQKFIHALGDKVAHLVGEGSDDEPSNEHPLLQHLQIARLYDLLPYEAYDEQHQLFYNTDATGFVLLGSPIVGASLEDQGAFAEFFRQAENLPEGCSMQFLLVASPKIDARLNYWQAHRLPGTYQALAAKRHAFLRDKAFTDAKGNLARDFRVLVSYTLPGHVSDPMAVMQLVQTRQALQGMLAKIGLVSDILDAQGLLREVGNILNFQTATTEDYRSYHPMTPLRKQLLDRDTVAQVKKDGVYLRDHLVQSYVPKSAPQHWALGHMDKFLGDLLIPTQTIPCPYLLHYGFYVAPHQGKEARLAVSKRESLENSIKNKLSKWMPDLEEQFQEARDATKQIQKGERVIFAGFSCTTFCKVEEAASVRQHLNQIWQQAGWRLQPATYDHLCVLFNSMPMTWTVSKAAKNAAIYGGGPALEHLGLAQKTITREAQNRLPIVGDWKGQVAPGLPLLSRRGQVLFWSPFDGMLLPGKELPKDTSNYNFCISGTMGSGKSFFCNEIITNTLSVGGKAFVLDKGESFKNLCLMLGGHHLDFDINTLLSLNPFTHIPEGMSDADKEQRSDQLIAVVNVIRTMAMPTEEPGDFRRVLLQKAVFATWDRYGSKGTIDAVCAWLQGHGDARGDKRAHDLATMLWPFTSQGTYGRFFNPPATVNLNHDLVVIETQNLHDELRAVIVQMMIMQVWQRMVRSDRHAPFLILIDEAWDLIRGKGAGDFIEAVARTARKYRGALGTATQNLTDYFKEGCSGARVAFENAAWKCILHQSAEVTTAMSEHPALKEFVSTSFKEQTIRSLLPAQGFSEVAIYGQKVAGIVGRLFCDPYSALLYSTNPQDFNDVQTYVKQGYAIQEAVEAVLKARSGQPIEAGKPVEAVV